MKYCIITFGCQMNEADSERIAASLEKNGYQPASKENEADLIVVNMCSVRQSAVDRVYGVARKFKALPASRQVKIVLTGCILKKDKIRFQKIFDEIWPSSAKDSAGKEKPSKFIPISSGCNNNCSYCAVPLTRGRLICRPDKEILTKVKKAVKNKIKEVWLLGQNVNDYRFGEINFSKLLRMVNDIPGDFKIRFMSPHPACFTDELIETMAKCRKVARYLNLPVQSGDNRILKAMNRPYTVFQYKNLVKKIKKRMPDINLSTDIIVGFPGETKKQFENTVKLFKELKFNIAYISKYSPRSGTAAFKLEDSIPIKEKKRRWKILNSLLS